MKYQYLYDLKTDAPLMIQVGLKLMGILEAPGAVNNPTIMGWAREIGGKVADTYKADSIAWCGLAQAVVCKRANKELVKDPLWALNWNTFGVRVEKGQEMLGDILVFIRNGGGHVGLYVGEDATAFHVMGGNQNDSYCITRIAKSRLYGCRRPLYNTPPLGMKKYMLSASGTLSQNEA